MLFIIGQSRTQKMLVVNFFVLKNFFVSDVKSRAGCIAFKTNLRKVLQSQTKIQFVKMLDCGGFEGNRVTTSK